MMDRYPLHALRQLLAEPSPTRGVVTARSGIRLTVATPQGARMALASGDASGYRIGHMVTLHAGVAYPTARASERYVV